MYIHYGFQFQEDLIAFVKPLNAISLNAWIIFLEIYLEST